MNNYNYNQLIIFYLFYLNFNVINFIRDIDYFFKINYCMNNALVMIH